MTQTVLHYDRSLAIDESLFPVANISQYGNFEVCHIANGERFTTYASQAKRDLEVIFDNDASARKADPEPFFPIVASYSILTERKQKRLKAPIYM